MLDLIASLGASSIRALWVPLVAWTVLWALAEGVLWTLRNAHPGIRYRLTQTVLWTLPLSLALTAWVPTRWLPSGWALTSWSPMPTPEPTGAAIHVLPRINAVELVTPLLAPGPNLMLVGLGLGVCAIVALALVSLVRLGMQSVAVVRLRRAIPRASDPAFDATAERIASSLGVEDAADIVLTPAAIVPMTLGIRRPLVIVPASLSPSDRQAALVHELVHVRERDPLAQAIEALVTALFSAHPAVHRLARQCDLLREMACDAAVLDHAGVRRRSYAALVSSFATPSTVRALPATVGMASPLFHVHHRLHAMSISRPLPSRLATWSPAVAVLLVAVLLVTAGTALAQTPQSIEEEELPVIVEEVTPERAEIRALRAEIETLTATSPHLVTEEIVEVHGTLREKEETLEATADRLRTLRSALNVVVESEYSGTLRQIDEETRAQAQAVYEEAETLTVSNFRRRTDLDSVRVAAQFLESTVIEEQIQALQEQLEALRRSSVLSRSASAIETVEQEVADAALETNALSLGDAYPNPAKDVVAIDVTVEDASDVTIGLYDLTGRQVVMRSLRLEPGAHKVQVDTRELAAGTYVSRVTAKSGGTTAQSTSRVTIVR